MRLELTMVMILFIGSVNAASITVGPSNTNYTSIQPAINSAHPGDLIEVHSGKYHENLVVSKNVILRGKNTGNGVPEINADGSGSVIIITGNGTTIEGFNLTNSGHCGCGNAGISVQSSNNTIFNNVIYKNKYGVYIGRGKNNSIMLNDFINNNITGYDSGGNHWEGTTPPEGLQGLIQYITGPVISGNHYSDYDEPKKGCIDANNDGFCDSPRNITAGLSIDKRPIVHQININQSSR
jgi:parallel beta-helix repeat protein